MSEIDYNQCFNKHQKNFLVSTTVYKARNLNVLNADTFVAVTFNDETQKTKTFPASDSPYFNEVKLKKNKVENLLNLNFSSILFLRFAHP
jgi:hypothetical protein